MTAIKTIIFDLDGTLINSSEAMSNAFRYALSPFNIELADDEIEVMRSFTRDQLFCDQLTPSNAKIALTRLLEYTRQSAEETILLPGVQSLLRNIYTKGFTIGLWTARDRASAQNILKFHRIESYFQAIVGGCEVKKNKPDPEGLYKLAQELKIDLRSTMHVGDHPHDVLGAQAAGVISVLVQGCHVISMPKTADFIFNTIDEFTNWLLL